MNDAGSTLTEYALIAALVSIVVLAVSRDLRFPGAPVVALSEVASGPRELGSPRLGSESRAYPPGSRPFAGAASGPGFRRGAGASGSADVAWIGTTATASPRARHPKAPDPTLFDVDAAMTATFAEPDDPTEGASSAGPDEETASPCGRQIGDRSTDGGKTVRIRWVSPTTPAHRPDPAAEQLVSLGPGSAFAALSAEPASFGGTAVTARELQVRATSGFSRQFARPAKARAPVATSTSGRDDRRFWTLVVLMLVGLGVGVHRLARRLRSTGRRLRNS